jgi:hypothetical protein
MPISRLRAVVPPSQVFVHLLQSPHVAKTQSMSFFLQLSLFTLHGLMSIVLPLHGSPPSWASTSTTRERDWCPLQGAEHSVHVDHWPRTQSWPMAVTSQGCVAQSA